MLLDGRLNRTQIGLESGISKFSFFLSIAPVQKNKVNLYVYLYTLVGKVNKSRNELESPLYPAFILLSLSMSTVPVDPTQCSC